MPLASCVQGKMRCEKASSITGQLSLCPCNSVINPWMLAMTHFTSSLQWCRHDCWHTGHTLLRPSHVHMIGSVQYGNLRNSTRLRVYDTGSAWHSSSYTQITLFYANRLDLPGTWGLPCAVFTALHARFVCTAPASERCDMQTLSFRLQEASLLGYHECMASTACAGHAALT